MMIFFSFVCILIVYYNICVVLVFFCFFYIKKIAHVTSIDKRFVSSKEKCKFLHSNRITTRYTISVQIKKKKILYKNWFIFSIFDLYPFTQWIIYNSRSSTLIAMVEYCLHELNMQDQWLLFFGAQWWLVS